MAKITIHDVAAEAGVSIATVSHVMNKTRYVRPELVERVENAIQKTGYVRRNNGTGSTLVVSDKMMVAVVIPELTGCFYHRLIISLSHYLSDAGYIVNVYISNEDPSRVSQIINMLQKQQAISGLLICPSDTKMSVLRKLSESSIPVISLGRDLTGQHINSINFDNQMVSDLGVRHLIKQGHEKILMLIDEREPKEMIGDRVAGYKNAYAEYGLKPDVNYITYIKLTDSFEDNERLLADKIRKLKPTAVFASGNRLTMMLLKTLQTLGLEWPKDISVIGYENQEWIDLISFPVTTIKQDFDLMARDAVKLISEKMKEKEPVNIRLPVQLIERESTAMIGKGAYGEMAISPDRLVFSEDEREQLKRGNYRVGISFHYGNTAWYRLHESGIRNTLSELGISVLSVSDADFDPQLQTLQLEGLRLQRADAVIAIPVNDELMAPEFKKLSRETKLIFLSSVPTGMQRDEYGTCVSVNERENGHNAGLIMGRYFKKKARVRVGMITHGAAFYGTQLRDLSARETIESFDNLEIVAEDHFYQIENAYSVCRKMVSLHPEIEALYISWDEPALRAIRALKEMGRQDIRIVTTDLDYDIARYLAKEEMVIGISTQRPYEQGAAAAKAAALALLRSGEEAKYVAVSPYTVTNDNLIKSWEKIFHEKLPEELFELVVDNLRK